MRTQTETVFLSFRNFLRFYIFPAPNLDKKHFQNLESVRNQKLEDYLV